MLYAPIALFVYNRPRHTKNLIDSLRKNREAAESDLIIISDAPKHEKVTGVQEVREYIKSLTGFRSVRIIERSENYGLARNIIGGVTALLEESDRLIVLEDDLIVSPYFLSYMNDGLNLYADDEKVGSIHGYVYPVKEQLPETFFLRGGDCWGWATWKRAWSFFEPDGRKLLSEIKKRGLIRDFDLNNAYPYYRMLQKQVQGKNSSWAVRWHASLFLRDMLTLYPGSSFVNNQGADDSGTHLKSTNVFEVPVAQSYNGIEKISTEESEAAKNSFSRFFFSIHSNPLKRIFRL
ncbi:MAG: glycosyltransferase [Ignavibacteriaceae bacterium]|nr:glycosyltransferase [Ignavibacteriaceae bacterium]